MSGAPPRIEARGVTKTFGGVTALSDVTFDVRAGEVHALLGDNGAGKSTLIRILAGVHEPTSGAVRMDGRPVRFGSPRAAARHGIATVYQDLALVPLLSVARNFFLAREPTRGPFPFRRIDRKHCRAVVREELGRLGLEIRDPDRPAGTLSGGERQAVAIARAVHFGARVLILDEPTAALGVAQTALVLGTVRALRERGVGVVLITHNVEHALSAADRFTVLDRGRVRGTFAREEIAPDALRRLMAGGDR